MKWPKYLQILHCRSDTKVRVQKEECYNNYQQESHEKRICSWHENLAMVIWAAAAASAQPGAGAGVLKRGVNELDVHRHPQRGCAEGRAGGAGAAERCAGSEGPQRGPQERGVRQTDEPVLPPRGAAPGSRTGRRTRGSWEPRAEPGTRRLRLEGRPRGRRDTTVPVRRTGTSAGHPAQDSYGGADLLPAPVTCLSNPGVTVSLPHTTTQ